MTYIDGETTLTVDGVAVRRGRVEHEMTLLAIRFARRHRHRRVAVETRTEFYDGIWSSDQLRTDTEPPD